MNWPTFAVAALIAAVIGLIIYNKIRKKKKGSGTHSCGGNCGACGMCHTAENNEDK